MTRGGKSRNGQGKELNKSRVGGVEVLSEICKQEKDCSGNGRRNNYVTFK